MALMITTMLITGCTGNRSDQNKEDSSSPSEKIAQLAVADGELYLFIGTYTDKGGSEGIYVHRFNTQTGASDSLSMSPMDNPSYLTVSPDHHFVYAVSESDPTKSAVHAFAINKHNGHLEPLNSRPVNSGGPCFITIDSRGKHLHTANYGGGSISSLQTNDDGSLATVTTVLTFGGEGADPSRQKQPHLHSVRYSPDGQYLFASDLGTDNLYRFEVNNTPFQGQPAIHESSLRVWETPPATGPRHFDFHPNGQFFYLLGELSGEVIVYDYNHGDLIQKQVIASDTTGAKGSADIHVSPDGRYLYTSNRLQADGLAIFKIDEKEGTLTRVGYQLTAAHPRNFAITPNGNFILVAAKDGNKVQVFQRDQDTGLLTDTGKDIVVAQPTCIQFAIME